MPSDESARSPSPARSLAPARQVLLGSRLLPRVASRAGRGLHSPFSLRARRRRLARRRAAAGQARACEPPTIAQPNGPGTANPAGGAVVGSVRCRLPSIAASTGVGGLVGMEGPAGGCCIAVMLGMGGTMPGSIPGGMAPCGMAPCGMTPGGMTPGGIIIPGIMPPGAPGGTPSHAPGWLIGPPCGAPIGRYCGGIWGCMCCGGMCWRYGGGIISVPGGPGMYMLCGWCCG